MASEMENLELLEERVRGVTDLVRNLRQTNGDLRTQLRETEERLRKAGEAIAALHEEQKRGEEVAGQLRLLQEERQEIRGRVSRMLEAFSGLEEAHSGHPDN